MTRPDKGGVMTVTHLCHKVCGCVAERFEHWRGLGVEQRHPVGHLVVHFILYVQLWERTQTQMQCWCRRPSSDASWQLFNMEVSNTGLFSLLAKDSTADVELDVNVRNKDGFQDNLRSYCLSGSGWLFFYSNWSRSEWQEFSSTRTKRRECLNDQTLCELNHISRQSHSVQHTLSSSKRRVKWRISANCLASACSLSRCWVGVKGGHVSDSNKLFRASSADKRTQTRCQGETRCRRFSLAQEQFNISPQANEQTLTDNTNRTKKPGVNTPSRREKL